MRRIASGLILAMLFSSLVVYAFVIHSSGAESGTVYIRANGSIEPSTAPISTANNITYTFNDNINDSIAIQRDNIILDGAGYTVRGTGTGIDLSGRTNVTINNAQIKDFACNVWLNYSFNNIISGNNITGYYNGIRSEYSSNNSITGNIIVSTHYSGLSFISCSNNTVSGNNIDSIVLTSSSSNIVSGNYMNNSGSYVSLQDNSSDNDISSNNLTSVYIYSCTNNTVSANNITAPENGVHLVKDSSKNNISNNNIISSGAGVLIYSGFANVVSSNDITAKNGAELDSCSQSSLTNNNIIDCSQFGVSLESCSNTGVSSNVITRNLNGMLLGSCSNNSVSDNNITNNGIGVSLGSCSGNNISGNNISYNDDIGLSLDTCFDNSVFGNSIVNNHVGVQLDSETFGDCSNNSIFDNNVRNNYIGLWLGHSLHKVSNNRLYHNNLINNTIQTVTSGWYNLWNLNYPLGGNYWSDYFYRYPNASEIDSSGIWNTPYVTNIDDIYPLNNADMYPLVIPEFSSLLAMLFFMTVTLAAVTALKRKQAKYRNSYQPKSSEICP